MIRKFLVGATGAALLLVAVPTSGAEAAAKINGTGGTHCTVTGSIKWSPGLVNGGTKPGKSSSKTNLSACTGTGDGAHVVSAKSSSTTPQPNNACPGGGAETLDVPQAKSVDITNTVKWKTDGVVKLNDSIVHYDTQTTTVASAGFIITIELSGSVVSGSFAGQASTTTLVLDETALTFLSNCGTKKGVKQVNFTGVNGASHT
jgi:hypothetical protein